MPWEDVPREAFEETWSELPKLTVLAALPGWGRTSWMRQCAAHLAGLPDGPSVRWLRSRADVERDLDRKPAEASIGPDRPGVVHFVDDVVESARDPLWAVVADHLAAVPGDRVVISSIDRPDDRHLPEHHLVLDERDLRLTPDELGLIAPRAVVRTSSPLLHTLDAELAGCPSLVREHVHALRAPGDEAHWVPELRGAVTTVLREVVQRWDGHPTERSQFVEVLASAAGLRRFTTSLLLPDPDPRQEVDLERLSALPVLVAGMDLETGEPELAWTPDAWSFLRARRSREEASAASAEALERVTASGRVVGRLIHLLDLGQLRDAEHLVSRYLRRFLVLMDTWTRRALLELDRRTLDPHPGLLLLAAEMRTREQGTNEWSLAAAARALELLDGISAAGRQGIGLSARAAFAAVAAGEREPAHAHLETVMRFLSSQRLEVHGPMASRPSGGQRLSEVLYLAYWAAHQLDRHEDALQIARRMVASADPADPVARLDQVGLWTQEDFAGLGGEELDAYGISVASGQAQADGSARHSHARSLILLEQRRDDDAMEVIRPILTRLEPRASRSALDGLLLLVQTLSAGHSVWTGSVAAAVDASRALWRDRVPSSFVSFAAAVAYRSLGERDRAAALLDEVPARDWFGHVALAVTANGESRFGNALDALEAAGPSDLPRLEVIARVQAAEAWLGLGVTERAAREVARAWTVASRPGLLDFALRLVSGAVPGAILEEEGLPDGARRVLEEASARTGLATGPQLHLLTEAELAVVDLLRTGSSNAEIATARGVSANTVRSQLKSIYRKLDVAGRDEVVEVVGHVDGPLRRPGRGRGPRPVGSVRAGGRPGQAV